MMMVSPTRSSSIGKRHHEQTDSDGDLDSSSSSSCITNSSKLKKRRANLPKDSVRELFVEEYLLLFYSSRFEY